MKQHNLIATGDDFSKVKLFRYPCNSEGASNMRYQGHSSPISNIKFSSDGTYVVSTGADEKTII